MLERRPDPAAEACECELCRALLELAASAVRNRAAAASRRATIHLVEEEADGEDR